MIDEEKDIISNAQSRILDLFAELDDKELKTLEQWLGSKKYRKDLENKKSIIRSDKLLQKIGDTIKEMVPFEAELPSENIMLPTVGDQADCNQVNTRHVDEFLYDEEQVDELVKDGKLSRHYCLDCNSQNIKELNLISHSMSRVQLQYIFKVLLPKDLEDKQILDVGSRFGGILYSAYYFTNASNIIGIEMNKECCEIQEKIIKQFGMDKNRIKIVHSDVTDKDDLVKKSNICIMNCFDFFIPTEDHKKLWYFFKKHLTKGSYIVLNRSIADTLTALDMFEEFIDWLSICRPFQLENEIFFDVEDLHEIFLYVVN
ncbi:uncharacterized protein LOC125235472 [Leguminivora glycinivorella]|uniref:uncharacterized protein LOC125235472 n=1 Tax=Leguminivora glycinivorella TaxID=1035111 RepID=UPI00200D00A2|nr:uncharacterized protein LOC125235472 [Leguminivora glycinivorella]